MPRRRSIIREWKSTRTGRWKVIRDTVAMVLGLLLLSWWLLHGKGMPEGCGRPRRLPSHPAVEPPPDPQLVGKQAPPLAVEALPPHGIGDLESLRGRVVLLVFLPGGTGTLDYLYDLQTRFHDPDLAILLVCHSQAPRSVSRARTAAARLRARGVDLPIAVDPEWETLERYQLAYRGHRVFTTTFLVDKAGVVRWIGHDVYIHAQHPSCGCKIDTSAGHDAFRELTAKVAELIKE